MEAANESGQGQALEGVIKFGLEFVRSLCISEPMIADINAWRQICFRLGLIGQAADLDPGPGPVLT